jgi:hypothetical protein
VTFTGRTGLVINEVTVITNNGNSARDLEQVAKFLEDNGWRRMPTATRTQIQMSCGGDRTEQPDAS